MSYSRRDEAYDAVYHLTTIGPRLATSLAEAQAAAYIDGRLRRAGMRVIVDTFQAPVGPGLTYLLLSGLAGLAALLTGWMPLPSLLLALWGLALSIGDGMIAPLPIIGARRDSQNVIGTRASEKLPRWRVVLLAPLDSAPAGGGGAGLSGSRRTAVIGRSIAFALLALLALAALLDRSRLAWWYLQIFPTTYLLLSGLPLQAAARVRALQARGRSGALAVLLSAAERLSHLRQVELWTVAVGATATGSGGIEDFLARYPFPRPETLWVGIESIDQGQLSFASREGTLRGTRPDSLLTRLVTDADAADELIDLEPRPYTDAPSICAPLLARGYRAITLVTHSGLGTSPARPPAEVIDSQMLERATRLVTALVNRLDESR